MTLTVALDLAAVFVFALTGALTASRAQLDIVGFIFIAALTAVGGGTLRDLFLGRVPVFWVVDPIYIGVIAVGALLVFVTAHLLESRYRAILWLDAAALAVAVPAGVNVAITLNHGPAVVVMMGIVTGCFGGLMRDVVCNEVPLVLRKGELYVTAAFAGGIAAALALYLGQSGPLALLICAGVTFLLRSGSMLFGWSLPAYKSRPPRDGPRG
ncbi:membrane protein [Actibacterium mucosum KCTC 23349]|uniref:Membrane protein n=1 Tax=Actibacterium mucosum KCTC 23349 TaxID=1454373 RepID=A0A037ZKK3_9RHOB|nr:trimeric intracellular cation channel family protein [Actibacterium mucosum]KAJ56941.1 membrane protein [Actibacterium mucosum KCTC 23349]